jgi:hypothetical protein
MSILRDVAATGRSHESRALDSLSDLFVSIRRKALKRRECGLKDPDRVLKDYDRQGFE